MAGVHLPVMPSIEVPVNTGTGSPAQIVSEVPKLNVGVIIGETVTESVTGSAQTPADGVKV